MLGKILSTLGKSFHYVTFKRHPCEIILLIF